MVIGKQKAVGYEELVSAFDGLEQSVKTLVKASESFVEKQKKNLKLLASLTNVSEEEKAPIKTHIEKSVKFVEGIAGRCKKRISADNQCR